MRQYHDLMKRILYDGIRKDDRTGTGTLSVFGHQMRFDLTQGFPLVTTKRLHTRSIFGELLWMLAGSTDNNVLKEQDITIWDEWARADGSLGPIYGKQWRSWPRLTEMNGGMMVENPIDQIQVALDQLRTNPDSRRIIVTAWNPADLEYMALAPCHMLFQFYTRPMTLDERIAEFLKRQGTGPEWTIERLKADNRNDTSGAFLDAYDAPSRYLDLQLYQRSSDVFLGVPFNIASYALLTHLMAREVGMVPGEFIWSSGDTHLYLNHLDQARLQLTREIRPLPQLRIREGAGGLFDLTLEDLTIESYDPHPPIKAEVSV